MFKAKKIKKFLASTATAASAAGFSDVPATYTHAEAINLLTEQKTINWLPGRYIRPSKVHQSRSNGENFCSLLVG